MGIRIALAGNPNAGKTTLFNALTGSNQFVGNWPGVTVEKKEGRLKGHDDIIITDLPGIYSLSPYTLEEVAARNYLVDERPDAILNIIDGTNLERNLYLTTQLAELGIPVVIAINMIDVVEKNGDKIDIPSLSRRLGCEIIEISALKGTGINEAAEAAIEAAKGGRQIPHHTFSGPVEHALAHIEEAAVHDLPEDEQRWYAIKVFERDEKVIEKLHIPEETRKHIEEDIRRTEREMDDEADSIITNERYNYITEIIKVCCQKHSADSLTATEKIDRVVTSRFLGLPVFALIMFFVYLTAMKGPGAWATDWTNQKLFGSGFHLFGIGAAEYEKKAADYADASAAAGAYYAFDAAAAKAAPETVLAEMKAINGAESAVITAEDADTLETLEKTVYFETVPAGADMEQTVGMTYREAVQYFERNGFGAPDPADSGVFVPSIPSLVERGLERAHAARWLRGLILDGIVAGVGAVLGFVPQMFVLFLLLAFLEACGYMARIAFVLDRLFRRFGLSGKSFIAMLVGTGCSVPGIMASRTIEDVNDRRMTIITTTFIPCGAKVPFIAMIAGAVFGRSPWVAVSAYFIGMTAVIVSGLMLKKLKLFSGAPSPFVMELPAYHMPMLSNVLRSMWERGWSFIKKAGSVILLSTVVIWFLSRFGSVNGSFGMLDDNQLDRSILAGIGSAVAWIFAPLGWGTWQAAVASVAGIAGKENIVGTMGVLYGSGSLTVWQALAQEFSTVTGFSFLVFNLLCAPCIAAIGAIRREMNSAKWTWFAILYQCGFAYAAALMITQFGNLFAGSVSPVGLAAAAAVLCGMLYMLLIRKPCQESAQKAG